MVASYSPTLTKRSFSAFKGIPQAIKSLRNAIASPHDALCSTPATIPQQTQLITQLAALPSNTFGHQWSQFISQASASNIKEDVSLGSLYVLTGYQNNALGTIQLQAFLFGATGQAMSLATCLRMMLSLCQNETNTIAIQALTQKAYQAYKRGQCSYFNTNDWHPEQLWDLPTPYVRQWFGLSA